MVMQRSLKQKSYSKKNIGKSGIKGKSVSLGKEVSKSRVRKKPGATGKGNFYHIIVRPKSEFVSFRNQDVGAKGHVERLAGKRESGNWATHAWLIEKTDAEVKGDTLVGKTKGAKEVISKLRRKPRKLKGDIFEAGPRKNVPEKSKPKKVMKTFQGKK